MLIPSARAASPADSVCATPASVLHRHCLCKARWYARPRMSNDTPSWDIEPVPDRLRVLGVFDSFLLWTNFGVSISCSSPPRTSACR